MQETCYNTSPYYNIDSELFFLNVNLVELILLSKLIRYKIENKKQNMYSKKKHVTFFHFAQYTCTENKVFKANAIIESKH